MLLIATLEVKPLQIVFIYQLRDNSGVIQLSQYQHLQVSKEMPTRHHYGEIHNKTLSRNTTFCSASLKCLYTNALDASNKQDELETCTCLEGSDLIWIMGTWDGSHDWGVLKDRGSPGRTDLGRWGRGFLFHRVQWDKALKKGLRKLVIIQGSPSSSSGLMHANKEEVM